MPETRRYSYTVGSSEWSEASLMPYLPFSLTASQTTTAVSGLVDSGAAVNVLPYNVGLQLGLKWDEQKTPIQLSGALSGIEARGITLTASVNGFEPVRLVFAWAKSNDMPTILGQTNFFMEFKVHFYRAQQVFDIEPK